MLLRMKKWLLFCIFFCANLSFVYSFPIFSDSLKVISTATTFSDTSDSSQNKGTELKGPVHYKADTIEFSINRRFTYLKGNAQIKYLDMILDAARITIDWNKSELHAEAVLDSLDSLGNPVYKGIPTFQEKGTDPMKGLYMSYNFKTKRGSVFEGNTKMDPGYYKGKNIKKIGKKTILVRDGYFTSCEYINHPHYYFYSKKMWVTMNDKLAGKPVILYIEDIPVFYLPAVFMSIKRDRRSGIIFPKYGFSANGGRYLRDFGFYWAINDYMDATLLSSFYDRRGFIFSGNFRYKLRYKLNGKLDFDYAPRDLVTGKKRQRYRISFSHNQTVSETLSLSAQGTFQSDKQFNQDYYDQLELLLHQTITTTVNIRKKLPSINSSINISMRRTENLQNGNISQVLPSISFSLPSRQIGKKGKSWYGNLSYSYSTFLESSYNKTLQLDSSYSTSKKSRWEHSFSLRDNLKVFKYFTLAPSLNAKELWVNEYRDYFWNDSTQSLDYVKKKGFLARHTFNGSINLRTTLYGLFEIPFGPLKYIRHKLDPSISYSFSPDFSSSTYGYFESFRDSSGNIIKGDKFADYGATPTSKAQTLNISVSNFFQGKMIENGEEKKIDILNWNLSTSYNILADSLKWSDIRSAFSTSLGKNLRLNGSMIHSFYEVNSSGTGKRNIYYYKHHKFPFRFVNANVSFGFSLNSDMFKSKEEGNKEKKKENQKMKSEVPEEKIENIGGISYILQENNVEKLKNTDVKWNASFNFSYNYNKSNILNPTKSFNMNSNMSFQLTKNWKINSRANLDVTHKKINYIEFLVYRDLHCWEMNFTWRPLPYSYFIFEIRVKANVLKDLKYTKRSSSAKFR